MKGSVRGLIYIAFLVGIGVALVALILGIKNARLRKREAGRQAQIWFHLDTWGADICYTLTQKQIRPDMTEAMVRLAWGNPTQVELKELTREGQKTRWIYRQSRQGARYVWFTNGRVIQIQS
jgi:hypothetical protein